MNRCPVCKSMKIKTLLNDLYPAIYVKGHPNMLTHSMDTAVACAQCGIIRLVPREYDFEGHKLKGS